MILLRSLLSPFFVYRFYLRQALKTNIIKYNLHGSIIDIGCGDKPYRYLFQKTRQYDGIDFANYSNNKDFVRNGPDYFFHQKYTTDYKLPIKNNSYNNSVCFQVLEHHANPIKLVDEMCRVTKKGGYILLSFPFIGGLHELPNDYQRLTHYGLMQITNKLPCKIVTVKKLGSIFSVCSNLFNEYLNNFTVRGNTHKLVSIFVYPFFLILSYLSLLLDKIFKSEEIFLGYLIIIKKNAR